MKTSKQISAAVVILLVVLITSAGTFPSVKETKVENKAEAAFSESQKQCGVSTYQIITYVRNLGHTVYWTYDIPGSCNTNVGVEGCTVVTVYVAEGNILGHQNSGGYCY